MSEAKMFAVVSAIGGIVLIVGLLAIFVKNKIEIRFKYCPWCGKRNTKGEGVIPR